MSTSTSSKKQPLTVGVFGGSFNPIHLGHALLAITVQQTKPVDSVVLVPVYKHAVKRDLLPFEDRVNMCELAVKPFGSGVTVSTVERDVGESNGAMLRGLKKLYPVGTRFLWICGDDFFRWMDRPKGLETLEEVDGLIVQRRLHRQSKEEEDGHVFFKEPIDEAKVRSMAIKMDLEIDFIYGELPHFSSTLVRRAPGNWRSFLTSSVSRYLDERPDLLNKLVENLEADADAESQAGNNVNKPAHRRTPSSIQSYGLATAVVMRGLEAVHALQIERGCTGLRLSVGTEHLEPLKEAQGHTDAILKEIMEAKVDETEVKDFDEVLALAAELKRIPIWLQRDRLILEKRADYLSQAEGSEGWLARLSLVEKFNPRVDVLIGANIRALTEILEISHEKAASGTGTGNVQPLDRKIPELLYKWCAGKEALGRLRAFVCSGGPSVPTLVRNSLKLRGRLNQTINTKERRIARVLILEAGMSSRLSAPDALHRMLENVTLQEYCLLGSFASSTPLPLVHQLLQKNLTGEQFEVVKFFEASSSAIDFLLSFAKALTASACASV
jgi:nicotinate (nicotinamide) nucleotide adenylyltransferase